jgi:hypothetical protein
LAETQHEMKKDFDSFQSKLDHICFPGETPIAVIDPITNEIYSVRIDSVRVGDLVVSCNLEQQICEKGEVTAVTQSIASHLIRFQFGEDTLRATGNHPIYLAGIHDWVPARSVEIGQELVRMLWKPVAVSSRETEVGEVAVYNLEVRGFHNYYASGVLVHNCELVKARRAEAVSTAARMADAVVDSITPSAEAAVPLALAAPAVVEALVDAAVVTGMVGSAAVTGHALRDAIQSNQDEVTSDEQKAPTKPNQMQQEVNKGQAPREIERVDKPHVPGQEPHVHYKNGTSSNQSGTVHDSHRGHPNPSKTTKKWLEKHGWTPPKK